MADLVRMINAKYPNEIQFQPVIRSMIEYQFTELKYAVYLRIIAHLIGCFLPVIIHVCYLSAETTDESLLQYFSLLWIFNVVCTAWVTKILYHAGIATYLNFLDILMPLYLTVYSSTGGFTVYVQFQRILILAYALLQLLVHLRIFEKFFVLTTLVYESISDLAPYGILVSLWTLGFRNLFV